jgi:uncharacterized protein (TIGR03086 family)
VDPVTRLQAGIDQARPVIAATSPADYDKPTPCPEWTVRELLNHMLGALTMFRDVARDGYADPALFARDLIGADALASFDAVAAEAVVGWSEPGKLKGVAKLPYGEFPAMFALQLPAMDMVVHAWDLSRATGQDVDWDADLVAETREFCESTFTNPQFRGNDFQPSVPVAEDADDVTKLVTFLGRQP